MEGASHLVQNNFGASLGGPVKGGQTFFFLNYEGLRKSKADAMIDTVPTAAEATGDFSQSGVTIFNPFSSRSNPNYDPSKPVSSTNSQILRDPFPGNRIPPELISPVPSIMLNRYVPRPNMNGDAGMGMTMNGVPQVVGAGLDASNYLDVRNEHHVNDQGTIRIDRNFRSGDSLFGRYSLGAENGFTPQNLPGFGAWHDNLAQQSVIAWTHVLSSGAVNTASIALSRLAMHRSSENTARNDIVSELGIRGVGYGGKEAFGAPWFAVQGYSGIGGVGFAALDMRAPSQYIQQWSASIQKSIGKENTLEIGYLGARGLHLQRAHLINNAPPAPGPLAPRRPYPTARFIDGTVLPNKITVASTTFPITGVNLLENTARSWYDAGYVNVRRRYSSGLSVLANYTFAKSLSDAPDFRSPMFESVLAQNNSDLRSEKGPACDIRHRFALSAVYELPSGSRWNWSRAVTRGWRMSTIYQVQSGFPFTVSVFGDTANAGTILGEHPIRANYTGAPIFGPDTRTADRWFNTQAFATPPAFTFGNVGRNTVYGPGMQTLDAALEREFPISEKARFRVRGELFNALNHTNLGTPNRFVNTPQFGTITEAATPNREAQLSVRVLF